MFFGLDLEAENWHDVTNACFVSDKGDVEHFEGPVGSTTCIEQAADFVDKTKCANYAHASGIYDTLLISQAREKPWQEVVMSGSAVLNAKDGRTSIKDTFRAWLSGLRKVGEYLDKLDNKRREAFEAWKVHRQGKAPEAPHGPPGFWLKKEVDRSRMDELSPKEKRDYVESDTQIEVEGVKEQISYLDKRGARRASTAGSAALHLLEKIEPASWSLLGKHRLDLETAIRACTCVRGARVETWALGQVDNVYCYDRKSAYPAAYAFAPIYAGAEYLGPGDADRPGAVWRCRWFWPYRGGESTITDDRARIPPVLDQVTGAGAGWCEAWLIDEEIRELEDFVGVRKIEGWAPVVTAPIGQLFVRDLYDEKEAGSFFAKTFLNALHGKMSETPIKDTWTSGAEPTDYYGKRPQLVGDYWNYLSVTLEKDGLCPRNVQPLAAANILGRARIALWRIIAKVLAAGYQVYYCDTDSIHTNAPPEAMAKILGREYGVGLGQLAPEGGPYTCFYVGPKSYCAIHTSTSAAAANVENAAKIAAGKAKPAKTGDVCKGACKGMPWGSLKDGIAERSSMWGNHYRQARGKEKGTDLRLDVFQEALQELEGARVKKEGIATWKQGLRMKRGWQRFETVRTLAPHERGKLFVRSKGPTVYAYQSPAELLVTRGVDLAFDPFAALVENPADAGELATDERVDETFHWD